MKNPFLSSQLLRIILSFILFYSFSIHAEPLKCESEDFINELLARLECQNAQSFQGCIGMAWVLASTTNKALGRSPKEMQMRFEKILKGMDEIAKKYEAKTIKSAKLFDETFKEVMQKKLDQKSTKGPARKLKKLSPKELSDLIRETDPKILAAQINEVYKQKLKLHGLPERPGMLQPQFQKEVAQKYMDNKLMGPNFYRSINLMRQLRGSILDFWGKKHLARAYRILEPSQVGYYLKAEERSKKTLKYLRKKWSEDKKAFSGGILKEQKSIIAKASKRGQGVTLAAAGMALSFAGYREAKAAISHCSQSLQLDPMDKYELENFIGYDSGLKGLWDQDCKKLRVKAKQMQDFLLTDMTSGKCNILTNQLETLRKSQDDPTARLQIADNCSSAVLKRSDQEIGKIIPDPNNTQQYLFVQSPSQAEPGLSLPIDAEGDFSIANLSCLAKGSGDSLKRNEGCTYDWRIKLGALTKTGLSSKDIKEESLCQTDQKDFSKVCQLTKDFSVISQLTALYFMRCENPQTTSPIAEEPGKPVR